jgi:hypothetical protein
VAAIGVLAVLLAWCCMLACRHSEQALVADQYPAGPADIWESAVDAFWQ